MSKDHWQCFTKRIVVAVVFTTVNGIVTPLSALVQENQVVPNPRMMAQRPFVLYSYDWFVSVALSQTGRLSFYSGQRACPPRTDVLKPASLATTLTMFENPTTDVSSSSSSACALGNVGNEDAATRSDSSSTPQTMSHGDLLERRTVGWLLAWLVGCSGWQRARG